jgi:hypothetical protein
MVRWAARLRRLAVRVHRSGSRRVGHGSGAMSSSTAAVGGESASERISTGWHDDGARGSSTAAVGGASTSERISTGGDGARGSSTAAVGGASTSERISAGGEHDDGAMGCCFARRERWERRFLVRVG